MNYNPNMNVILREIYSSSRGEEEKLVKIYFSKIQCSGGGIADQLYSVSFSVADPNPACS